MSFLREKISLLRENDVLTRKDLVITRKYVVLTRKDLGKTKIKLLCLVRERGFFRVGQRYGPLVRTENPTIIQP